MKKLTILALLSLAPAALFAGSNPKATGSFTFVSNVDGNTAYIVLNAKQMDSNFDGQGTIYFQDGVGTAYLDVKYVRVDGTTAWIASQVGEGSNYPGQPVGSWFVNKVVDNAEPGVNVDTIQGAAIGQDLPGQSFKMIQAHQMVADPSVYQAHAQTGDLKITSGNIQVHP
jgi:hypothetical protein